MGSFLAVVTLKHVSGLVEDQVVNTFPFLSTAANPVPDADLNVAGVAVADFYNGVSATSGSTVANLIGSQISRAANAVTIKYYNIDIADMGGAPHGSPIHQTNFTLGLAQGGETNLPSEVAIVLSYHADLTDLQQEAGATRPAARARGRLYIGPLNTLARSIDGVTNKAKVSTVAMNTLKDAGARLMGTTDPNWGQWSRMNLLFREVTGGFVDDAFDTQRRRGEKASVRTTFGV